jgi:hypothetical protein
MVRRPILLWLAALTGGASPVSAAEPATIVEPEQRFSGLHEMAFEVSVLDGCWLSFSSNARKELTALYPDWGRDILSRRRVRYRIDILGVRESSDGEPRSPGFGHLGRYPCRIEATRTLAIERLPDDPPAQ